MHKVAIVVDNNLKITEEIVDLLRKKYKSCEVFHIHGGQIDKFAFIQFRFAMYKIEQLDLAEFDVVYTVSIGLANGVITNLETKHINIMVGFYNWFFNPSLSFLKHKIRHWLQLSLQRAEINYCVGSYLLSQLGKINNEVEFVDIASFTELELKLNLNPKDYFVFIGSNIKTKILTQSVDLFNKTGKKLYVINSKVKTSDSVIIVNADFKTLIENARGVIFDQYFYDRDFIENNFTNAVPVLIYKNSFICEIFRMSEKFTIEDIDNFENEFARFVSWSKLQKDSKMFIRKIQVDKNKII